MRKGKLTLGHHELPFKCDICGKARNLKVHAKCSKIRQQKHEQMILDAELDRLMMFDLNQTPIEKRSTHGK